MIDEFTVFNRGGLVLWSHKLTAVIGRPIDTVIQTVLLLDRQSQAQYKNEKYTVKWTFANDVELIFAAVYLNMSNALYIDTLMEAVKNEFVAMYKAAIAQEKKRALSTSKPAHVDFDSAYKRLLRAAMESTMQKRQQRPFDPNRKSKQRGADAADNDGDDDDDAARDTINETKTNDSHVTDNGAVTAADSNAPLSVSDTTSTSGVNMDKLKALQLAAARGQVRQMRTGPPSKKKNADTTNTTPTKKTKQPTKWADGKMSKADIRNLDYSAKVDGADSGAVQQYNAMGDGEEATKANFSDDDDDDDDEEGDADTNDKASNTPAATTSTNSSTSNSGLFGFFKGLVGMNELSRQDLEPILTQFKSSLMAKNVAQEIAEKLCESVCVTLMGKKLQSFTTIKTTVRNSIEEALTRILTPDRQVDVLQGIAAAQAEKRPYSIVFLGVNGVGKCFAKDTQLMTYDGRYVHAQSVTYETVLMGDDSTPRHITPGSLIRGNAPLYQITPESPLVNAHTVNGHHIMCLVVNEEPITEEADQQYIVHHWQSTQDIPTYTKSIPFATRALAQVYKNSLVETFPLYYEVDVNDWINNQFVSDHLKRASSMYKPSSIMYQADRHGHSTLAQMAAAITSIELTSAQVSELAWLIGLWLNNPHDTPTIIINTAHQQMLIDRCHRATDMLTLPLIHVTTHDRHTELDIGGYDGVFGQILEKLNMTNEQRIPHALLTDTLAVRTEIFNGLTLQHTRNEKPFDLCALSLAQLDDIKRLALSLGHSAFITDKSVCCINCVDSTSFSTWRFKVDCVGAGDYYGFTVDGNSRFLLYDFTVTHNSTSLAKTCAYFRSKGLTVGIGACDTFRAGAIEQLRTHANALNVTLYAKGYDRDAAAVCSEAISSARKDGLDVILIDTAGRMQDNEPLMRALSKLIHINKPDLILFVGEALVGNDAVDQASKFNRCLSDLSGDFEPRLIDGIILTKFDTIDDKVGAAISMAYTTGRPIMFVGTGQTYTDLKRMSAKTLIKALLK